MNTASARRCDALARHLTAAVPSTAAAAKAPTVSSTLSGKRVILTGGGSGMGRAIALAFAARGASVVIGGRREGALLETARLLPKGASGEIIPHTTDIGDADSAQAFVDWAAAALGGSVDICVNNAGLNVPQRALGELSPDNWTRVVQVNLNGTFYVTHAVLPYMRDGEGGDGDGGLFLNVSSIAGRQASSLAGAAYCASKFGMRALGDALNAEQHGQGIRVTNIMPGEVATEILDKRANPPPPEVRARMLQPEDIAAAAVMVAELPPRAHVPEIVLTGKTTVERGGVPMW